jgi:DNA polymerase-3 subunit beta
MKVSVNKDTLLAVINRVQRALPSKPTDPAMSAIRINISEVNGSHIATAEAYDGEYYIKGSFPVTLTGEAEELRPSGQIFSALVKDLPDGEISFELSGSQILVSAGKGKFKVPQLGASPLDPSSLAKPTIVGSVSGEVFADAISKVIASASTNNTLPVLNSVKIEAKEDKLVLVATDRYRLSKVEIPFKREITEEKSLLVPTKVIMDIARAYSKTLKIEIGINDTLGFVSGDGVETTYRVIGGVFPDYSKILGGEQVAKVTFDSDEFKGALKRVSKFNSEAVKLTISKDSIILSNSQSENGEGAEEISASSSLEENFSISYNPQYLTSSLNYFSGKVTFSYEGSTKPATITSETDKNYLNLIMPVSR